MREMIGEYIGDRFEVESIKVDEINEDTIDQIANIVAGFALAPYESSNFLYVNGKQCKAMDEVLHIISKSIEDINTVQSVTGGKGISLLNGSGVKTTVPREPKYRIYRTVGEMQNLDTAYSLILNEVQYLRNDIGYMTNMSYYEYTKIPMISVDRILDMISETGDPVRRSAMKVIVFGENSSELTKIYHNPEEILRLNPSRTMSHPVKHFIIDIEEMTDKYVNDNMPEHLKPAYKYLCDSIGSLTNIRWRHFNGIKEIVSKEQLSAELMRSKNEDISKHYLKNTEYVTSALFMSTEISRFEYEVVGKTLVSGVYNDNLSFERHGLVSNRAYLINEFDCQDIYISMRLLNGYHNAGSNDVIRNILKKAMERASRDVIFIND